MIYPHYRLIAMLSGHTKIHRKMPISSPRLEQAIEAQKAHDALQAISDEFFYRADLLAESARCVLSYPNLIPEVRAKIARIEQLTTLALGELHRLQSSHESVINAYALAVYGLRPGMVIRPAKKPRDRRVGVSRLSIDPDGILTAHGWRVASLKGNHPKRCADSVRLVENAWSVEPEESLPDAPPESSHRWSQPPILDHDTPKDALRHAGERLLEFCRSLLFDATSMFPNGIPITVVEVTERA